jgi:hypothetical protein
MAISPKIVELIKKDGRRGASIDTKDLLRRTIKIAGEDEATAGSRWHRPGCQPGDLLFGSTALIVPGDEGFDLVPGLSRKGCVELKGKEREYVTTWNNTPKDAKWDERSKGLKRANGNIVYEQTEIHGISNGKRWRIALSGRDDLKIWTDFNDKLCTLSVEMDGSRMPVPPYASKWKVTSRLNEGGNKPKYELIFTLKGIMGEPDGPTEEEFYLGREAFETLDPLLKYPEPKSVEPSSCPQSAPPPRDYDRPRTQAEIDDDIPF